MALVGFPDQIDVTLGSKWSGHFGLDPDDVVVLTKISGQNQWSENGTNTTFDSSTNRLYIEFYPTGNGGTPSDNYLTVFGPKRRKQTTTTPTTIYNTFTAAATIVGGDGSDYTFREVFTDTGAYVGQQNTDNHTGHTPGNYTWFPLLAGANDYDVHIFTALEEHFDVVNVPNKIITLTISAVAPTFTGSIDIPVVALELNMLTHSYDHSGCTYLYG
jgi:hypothetical protein